MENVLHPIRVFLVDDSPAICERLAELLHTLPGVVLIGQSDSADEAVAGILQSRPNFVVLDLQLRKGSGLTVLSQVHAQAPAIVFVVLTNNSGKQYRDYCLAAGAGYFFDKSSEFQQVRDVIGGLGAAAAQP